MPAMALCLAWPALALAHGHGVDWTGQTGRPDDQTGGQTAWSVKFRLAPGLADRITAGEKKRWGHPTISSILGISFPLCLTPPCPSPCSSLYYSDRA